MLPATKFAQSLGEKLGLSFISIPSLVSWDKRRLWKRTGSETQTCVRHTYHPKKGIDFNSKMTLSDSA
ncbi:MAG: hypothetical protein ACK5TU_08620 [Cyclobacteriaceae bacterium]